METNDITKELESKERALEAEVNSKQAELDILTSNLERIRCSVKMLRGELTPPRTSKTPGATNADVRAAALEAIADGTPLKADALKPKVFTTLKERGKPTMGYALRLSALLRTGALKNDDAT